jgi:hypothetical protein
MNILMVRVFSRPAPRDLDCTPEKATKATMVSALGVTVGLATLSVATAAKSPHILFIVADDVRELHPPCFSTPTTSLV